MEIQNSPDQGDIVLCRFPFADTFAYKTRPAVIMSKVSDLDHVVVCFVSTGEKESDFDIRLKPNKTNNLKEPSILRISKMCSINQKLLLGKIGVVNETDKNSSLKKISQLFGL